MSKRPILLGAAVAAMLSTPASAQAAKLDPLLPCYVAASPEQRQVVGITAQGFTTVGHVDVFLDEIFQNTAEVSYAGTVNGSIPAPFIESGQRAFSVRLTEKENPLNTVTAFSKVTAFSVEQLPRSARTTQRVRFRGRGFTQSNAYIFAHYLFAGMSKKTVQIAYPKGPCGTFNVRRRQFPFKKRPATGSWTIQFDQEPVYSPLTATKVAMTIKVRQTPRGSRAR